MDREKARFSTWYEMFPRSCESPVTMAPLTIAKNAWLMLLKWVSIFCICLRFIPLDGSIAKARITASRYTGRSRQSLGHRGERRRTRCDSSRIGHARRFEKPARRPKIRAWKSPWIWRSSVHPIILMSKLTRWFQESPDGTMQYAENPPKKYQDIYPLYFEWTQCQDLCKELKRFVLYWINQGVRIFPRRQPAHQTLRFLGMAYRRHQVRLSGRVVSGGSLHPSQGHVPAC